jgi:hypothetical protein
MLFGEGFSIDHKKIKTMARWPMPKDKTKVRHFTGLATYMKKYVRIFVKTVTLDGIAKGQKLKRLLGLVIVMQALRL